VICLLIFATLAKAQGQWSALQNLPYIPVHTVMLPNGTVLMISYYEDSLYPQIWDPVSGSVTPTAQAPYELFCAGHTLLADGRVFLTGGHIADYVGYAHALIYDPQQDTYTAVPDMNAGRWYPSNTILPNGDVLVVSGDMTSNTTPDPLPQVYQVATNTWRNLSNAQLQQPLYPVMLLAPNGQIFNSGPLQGSLWLDTSGAGNWSQGPGMNFNGSRDYGPGLFYGSGKVLEVGGSDPPTATAEVIDLNASNPTWTPTGSMNYPRRQHNAVALPDGTVFVVGGSSGPGFDNSNDPVYPTELWSPTTGQWTVMPSIAAYRGYHSTAFLLPDGRVYSGGGNVGGPNYQIFSPPYLSAGARPTISSAPTAAGYGQTILIGTPNAASIAKVSLIRLPATTHTFDQNNRFETLAFTQASGGVNVTFPANSTEQPPGHYMLFLVNSSGVPSVAAIIQIASTVTTTGTINGIVTTTAGVPLSGVTVSGGGASTETLTNGSFTLTNLAAGSVTLTATLAGYQNATMTVTVQANTALTAPALQLAPTAPGSITGTVTDNKGNAIAGATVSGAGETVVTASNGSYSMSDVPAGTVTLTVTANGYANVSETVTVNSGAAATAPTIQLVPNDGNVSGTVTNSAGTPLAGVSVNFGGGYTTTDANGNYALNKIPAGTIQLVVAASGYNSQTQNVTITGGNTTTANFALTAVSGNVSGTVTSSAGAAIAGAVVSFSGGSTTTNAGGNYVLNNVPAGTIQLSASANGYNGQSQSVSITGGSTATANFTLIATNGNVSGMVTSSAGGAIAGATVSFSGGNTTTNANGNYSLNNVPAGTIQLQASANGYNSQTQSVNIAGGSTATANFALAAAGAPPGFTLSTSGNLTLTPGQSSGNSMQIALTPVGGFTGQVNLTCAVTTSMSNASNEPTCSGIGAVTVSGSGAVVIAATINTTAPTVGALAPARSLWASAAAFAVLLCVGVPRRRRAWRLMLVLAAIAVVSGALSCGAGGGTSSNKSTNGGNTSTGGTTAGTYTVTVNGSDAATGKITAGTSFNVVVN